MAQTPADPRLHANLRKALDVASDRQRRKDLKAAIYRIVERSLVE